MFECKSSVTDTSAASRNGEQSSNSLTGSCVHFRKKRTQERHELVYPSAYVISRDIKQSHLNYTYLGLSMRAKSHRFAVFKVITIGSTLP